MTEACSPNFSICVYCGSRPGLNPAFAHAARSVGQWIGEYGGQLVYGGGRSGLMGVVADAALAAGARVVGVIPQSLVEREQAHRGCTELLVVETMHERKRLMAEHADAFIALPGGIGTMEEFFEIWTWRQLGYHNKPVGLLNIDGYYDGLNGFLQHALASGFLYDGQIDSIASGSHCEPLLQELVHAAGFPAPTRLSAI